MACSAFTEVLVASALQKAQVKVRKGLYDSPGAMIMPHTYWHVK